MKDKSILISMGIIIYIVMSGIDRFVYHIPNVIYILYSSSNSWYCVNFNWLFQG